MSEVEFLERIAEILNIDTTAIDMHTVLKDQANFDSVAVLSIIILLDEMGKTIPGSTIRECGPVADLWALATK